MPMNVGRIFYRIFIYNYKIKLFCLLSAIFFWFYINLDNQYEHVFDVPLNFVNLPKEHVLMTQVPLFAKVRFQGSGRAFLGFRFRNRKIVIDISEIPNNTRIPLTLDMIHGIPSEQNVKPIAIVEPKTLFLHWVKTSERKVPIIPKIQCVLEDGYTKVGKIELIPDSLSIRGPHVRVDTMQWVPTETKIYTHVNRKLEGEIPLRKSPHIHYSAKKVKFRVNVQRIGERTIFELPVYLLHVPEGMKASVKPPVVTMTLQGGVEILSRLGKDDITLTIDYSTLSIDSLKSVVPKVHVPQGILSFRLDPSSVEVIVNH